MEKLREFVKDKKSSGILILLGLAGILMIAFSDFSTDDKVKVQSDQIDSIEYTKSMEKDLKDILEKIQGVGKTTVMITLEGTEEYVYAQNEKQNIDENQNIDSGDNTINKKTQSTEKSYVFTDSGANRKALKITSIRPKIKGVLVVCQGGGEKLVQTRITEACATALGIRYSQIFVAKSN